jgi:acyl-CoA synthetase (AMP-forming)/AMP-acid ligase II
MYKSGGEKFHPREVEIALEEHPEKTMAAIIGVPDPVDQEVGVAYMMPLPGCDPEIDVPSEFRKQQLANFKVPKRVSVSPELPMLPIGKIDRVALTDAAIAAPSDA